MSATCFIAKSLIWIQWPRLPPSADTFHLIPAISYASIGKMFEINNSDGLLTHHVICRPKTVHFDLETLGVQTLLLVAIEHE